MLVGAARYLAETRNFDGTAVLIFQPGEEGFAGAKAMIEDGLFERFPVDSVYAMHNWPGMRPGTVGVNPGPMMAAADRITIEITGPRRPWRASLPHGRPGAGGGAHHHRGAKHRVAQRAPGRQAVVSLCGMQAGDPGP
jgi:metal-dependent amidase/aminoacylase/carboxypeptidase family protein